MTDGGTPKKSRRVVAADRFGEYRPIYGWRGQCGIRGLEEVPGVGRVWPVKGEASGVVMEGKS